MTTRRRPALPRVQALALITALGVPAAGLTACSTPPEPDSVAAALAAGLAKGDLSGVPLKGTTAADATTALGAITKALGNRTHTVALTTVAKDQAHPEQATATLTTTWAVTDGPKGTWSYTTTAPMTLADDTWSVTWAPSVVAPGLAAGEALALTRTSATRADIIGAGNVPLVTERDVYQVGIDKARVSAAQAQISARALAVVLDIDPATYANAVASGGPKQFVVAVTLRATDELMNAVEATARKIPGAARVPATVPLAPTREFARAVLGTVGPATAEVVSKSNGAVGADELVGLSGLSARYDAQLRGTPGVTVEAVGTASGGQETARSLFSVEPVDGTPLVTTLDLAAQQRAEAALAATTSPAALVAVRPSTGAILAAANGPATGGLNLATAGQFAPGSTFKIVSSLALLRSGLTPTSPVPCTTSLVVDGLRFENYDAYPSTGLGTIPLTAALANSCNTAFISQHERVDQAGLAAAAESLGFGVDLDLGFPAYLGSIPVEASATEHAASFIGQAKVQASPMALAAIVASVLAGKTVRPVLLPAWKPATPAPTPGTPLATAEAAALRQMMHAVVTSGSGRVLTPGGATIAKTGTAEYGPTAAPKRYTWMVAGRGDLAVAVFVKDGISGSRSAGPILLDFLQATPR